MQHHDNIISFSGAKRKLKIAENRIKLGLSVTCVRKAGQPKLTKETLGKYLHATSYH